MKNILLLLAFMSLLSTSGFTQNNIILNIHHMLGNAEFEMDMGSKNNIDHDFKVSRLQYYISEISIIHDGGIETMIEDLWLLVDADKQVEADLGYHNINVVEKIRIHVGVDQAHNHLDPSSFPAFHPLSPKFPSMHWGWNAGYRFLAFEGHGGSNYNQVFELHSLGDDNYFMTEIDITGSTNNNEVILNLDADYTRILEDIYVNSGVIVHGDYQEAKKALENFRDYVFSESKVTATTEQLIEENTLEIYPNPTRNGNVNISFNTPVNKEKGILVTDAFGKQIAQFNNENLIDAIQLSNINQGIYFVNLIQEGQIVSTEKLISN